VICFRNVKYQVLLLENAIVLGIHVYVTKYHMNLKDIW